MRYLVFLCCFLVLVGCEKQVTSTPDETPIPTPDQEPDVPVENTLSVEEWAAGGLKAIATDLTEDGKKEWVVATATNIRVVSPEGEILAEAPLNGGIQVLSFARFEGETIILAGTGQTVHRREGLARLTAWRLVDGQLVEDVIFRMPVSSERHEIVAAIQRRDGRILVAHFIERFVVEARTMTRTDEGWDFEPIGQFRMATSWGLGDVDDDGQEDIVVGRIYGDEVASDGDAFLLRPDGSRLLIPTTRGVRSLHVANLDDDSRPEIYIADGWHQHYQAQAEAIITRADIDEGAAQSRRLAEFDDDFTVWKIETRRGEPASLYVRTSTSIFRVSPEGESTAIAGVSEDFAIGDSHILVLSSPPALIDF